MNFNLPAVLKEELKIYDPHLRKAAQLEAQLKSNQKPKRTTSPFGKVTGLIPEEIVSAELQEKAVAKISENPVNTRYHIFQRPVRDAEYPVTRLRAYYSGTRQEEERLLETYAIIYHYESRWIAAWIMPKDDPALYGVSYTYRDSAATIKKLSQVNFREGEYQDYHFPESSPAVSRVERKIGRTTYVTHTALITPEMIRNGHTTALWASGGLRGYSKKGKDINDFCLLPFEETLSTRIPVWKNGGNLFERIRFTASDRWLYANHRSYFYSLAAAKSHGIDPATWQLTASNVIDLFLTSRHKDGYFQGQELENRTKIVRTMHTPRLKAWVQNLLDDYLQAFNDPQCQDLMKIDWQMARLHLLFNHLESIQRIWSDIPLDFIHDNMDALMQINCPISRASEATMQWLADHMPIKTYFHLLAVHLDKEMTSSKIKTVSQHRYSFDIALDLTVFQFQDFVDTISMLNEIFAASQTIDPPKRWRINEFHEHIQVKAWTISTDNIELPQDLFPSPIKVNVNTNDVLTLFQPMHTHQLAQWGRSVRNCVGNASSYANEVKAKKSFLVLGLLNNRPTFTMQLHVEHGQLNVRQIVGYANSRLNDEQQQIITTGFKEALQIRAHQSSNSSID